MRKCHFRSQKEEQGEKRTALLPGIYSQSALKIAANSCILYFYYELLFYLHSKQFIEHKAKWGNAICLFFLLWWWVEKERAGRWFALCPAQLGCSPPSKNYWLHIVSGGLWTERKEWAKHCFMCQERKLRECNDEERCVPRRGGW